MAVSTSHEVEVGILCMLYKQNKLHLFKVTVNVTHIFNNQKNI